MSDVKASPRPWKIKYEMNVVADRDGGRGIVCSNATVAACGGFSSNMKNTTDENRANARLIVRAVNSHERLVEALREIAAFNDDRGNTRLQATGSYSAFDELTSVRIARAALAAAEGDA